MNLITFDSISKHTTLSWDFQLKLKLREWKKCVHIIKCVKVCVHFLPKIKCVLHVRNNYGWNKCKEAPFSVRVMADATLMSWRYCRVSRWYSWITERSLRDTISPTPAFTIHSMCAPDSLHKSLEVWQNKQSQASSHLIMHRTIGLTGTIGPITLVR